MGSSAFDQESGSGFHRKKVVATWESSVWAVTDGKDFVVAEENSKRGITNNNTGETYIQPKKGSCEITVTVRRKNSQMKGNPGVTE